MIHLPHIVMWNLFVHATISAQRWRAISHKFAACCKTGCGGGRGCKMLLLVLSAMVCLSLWSTHLLTLHTFTTHGAVATWNCGLLDLLWLHVFSLSTGVCWDCYHLRTGAYFRGQYWHTLFQGRGDQRLSHVKDWLKASV